MTNTRILDWVGISSSALCAVHCAILPMLLVAGTVLPVAFSGEFLHEALMWLIIPAALFSLGLGCARHKDRAVFILGALGLLGMFLPFVTELSEVDEQVAVLISAAFLISAHIRNYRLCRSSECEHDHG